VEGRHDLERCCEEDAEEGRNGGTVAEEVSERKRDVASSASCNLFGEGAGTH